MTEYKSSAVASLPSMDVLSAIPQPRITSGQAGAGTGDRTKIRTQTGPGIWIGQGARVERGAGTRVATGAGTKGGTRLGTKAGTRAVTSSTSYPVCSTVGAGTVHAPLLLGPAPASVYDAPSVSGSGPVSVPVLDDATVLPSHLDSAIAPTPVPVPSVCTLVQHCLGSVGAVSSLAHPRWLGSDTSP